MYICIYVYMYKYIYSHKKISIRSRIQVQERKVKNAIQKKQDKANKIMIVNKTKAR